MSSLEWRAMRDAKMHPASIATTIVATGTDPVRVIDTSTARTDRTMRPANLFEMRPTGITVWEMRKKL